MTSYGHRCARHGPRVLAGAIAMIAIAAPSASAQSGPPAAIDQYRPSGPAIGDGPEKGGGTDGKNDAPDGAGAAGTGPGLTGGGASIAPPAGTGAPSNAPAGGTGYGTDGAGGAAEIGAGGATRSDSAENSFGSGTFGGYPITTGVVIGAAALLLGLAIAGGVAAWRRLRAAGPVAEPG
jgi:hypothetical protein